MKILGAVLELPAKEQAVNPAHLPQKLGQIGQMSSAV